MGNKGTKKVPDSSQDLAVSSFQTSSSSSYNSSSNNNNNNNSYGNGNYNNHISSSNNNNNNSNASSASNTVNKKQELEKMFNKYKSEQQSPEMEDEDYLGGEGIMAFTNDLGIDPTGIELLIILWKINSLGQLKVTREEFVNGFDKLYVYNKEQILGALPKWKAELNNEKVFKKFYVHTFKVNREPGQKSMSIELAVFTWKLILKDKYALLDDWCDYVETILKKSISKDTWDNFYDFILAYRSMSQKELMEKYDTEAAWPVAIDDFVEFIKKKQ